VGRCTWHPWARSRSAAQLAKGLGVVPPIFVLLGLLGEKDFAVLFTDCLATDCLAPTIASDSKGRHRSLPTLSGSVASASS
jgi:hypothetical protein